MYTKACPFDPNPNPNPNLMYEGAGHGYMNNHQNHAEDRRKMNLGGDATADKAAAAMSWTRTVEFLARHLKGGAERPQ